MGCRASTYLGVESAAGLQSWDDATRGGELFSILAHIYNAIFIIELFVRFSLLRLGFLWMNKRIQKWAIFDCFIVFVTSVDLYIMAPLAVDYGDNQASFIRLIRFAKAVRALRVIRVMHLFGKLRILSSEVANPTLCPFPPQLNRQGWICRVVLVNINVIKKIYKSPSRNVQLSRLGVVSVLSGAEVPTMSLIFSLIFVLFVSLVFLIDPRYDFVPLPIRKKDDADLSTHHSHELPVVVLGDGTAGHSYVHLISVALQDER